MVITFSSFLVLLRCFSNRVHSLLPLQLEAPQRANKTAQYCVKCVKPVVKYILLHSVDPTLFRRLTDFPQMYPEFIKPLTSL